MKNNLLECIEIEPKIMPRAVVIWMHGLGADGNDFVDIVPQLHLPDNSAIKFIFPHAPLRSITINNGCVMRAWYDIKSLSALADNEDKDGIYDSVTKIHALIDKEKSLRVPSDKIILAGFSQGGAIALHVGLRYPEKLAGIIALSSYLPLQSTLAKEKAAANNDTPLFMAHGKDDPLIPINFARESKDLLTTDNYQVAWHEYSMQHSVCTQEINDISKWIQRILT